MEFAGDGEAEEAIAKFDGYELGGRKLRVNAAQERAPRPPRFQGGGLSSGSQSGGFSGGGGRPSKPKGSRRGMRGKKRSL